ncbi:MAG: OsmC family protein [Candidatus Zixiibacteriota bacterium]
MHVNVSWKGKLAFEADTESGHQILLDAKPNVGGEDKGPRPMEVLLVSLAGCTGMDVVSILKKKRVNLQNMTIRIDADRALQHPKYFTKIEVKFNFEGRGIKEEDVKQAIELSANKYCSIGVMLQDKAEISYRWEIANSE